MTSRPAAGGGRWVSVAPSRLAGWLAGFEQRHGGMAVDGTTYVGADGAVAEVEVPFGPLVGDLVAHVLAPRTVGVLLVRKGGYAAGVFAGGALVSSKVGSRHVQGKTAAGGWSQQRYARRRDNQTTAAAGAAADTAARVLLAQPLDGVVTGGDRGLVAQVLADPRLAGLPVTGRLLDVPDPRLRVLEECRWADVWIKVTDPA